MGKARGGEAVRQVRKRRIGADEWMCERGGVIDAPLQAIFAWHLCGPGSIGLADRDRRPDSIYPRPLRRSLGEGNGVVRVGAAKGL